MVASAISIADLFTESEEIDVRNLRKKFIDGRDSVLRDLVNIEQYLGCLSVDDLREQILFYRSLAIEASELDHEYKLYSPLKQSDPNYEELRVMYSGIRNLMRREIRQREKYASSVK